MCDCRAAVNERLVSSNAKIAMGLLFGEGKLEAAPPMIVLEKADDRKRGRLPVLVATCCPFCGERFSTKSAPDDIETP